MVQCCWQARQWVIQSLGNILKLQRLRSIAHAINKGWIDAQAHGPMAVLGWNTIQTKVNSTGEVEGTCVGTGMSFDPAFYYNRPVNVAAAHGYGPVIMAGAEMIRLMKNYQVVINDAAVIFYPLGIDWKTFR